MATRTDSLPLPRIAMAEPVAPDLLTLVQWLSPAFPTGAFAYSHGLEAAVVLGDVQDEAGFADWLADILDHGSGWTDAVLLALALSGSEDAEDLAATARALAGSRGRLRETTDLGTAFGQALARMVGQPDPAPMPLPVAFGLAARRLDLPARLIVAMYLQSMAANLVSAAVRFVPLGQSAGQRVLAAQKPRFSALAERACAASLHDLGTAAFRAEWQAMRQETLDTRIYRT